MSAGSFTRGVIEEELTMETYKKPFIEIVELQKEDAILTSCTSDNTCNHGDTGDGCGSDGGSCSPINFP